MQNRRDHEFQVFAKSVAILFSLSGNLIAALPPPPTVPFTQAQVSGICTSEGFGYSDTESRVAGGSQLGISNSGEVSASSAFAVASFFSNGVRVASDISAPADRFVPGPAGVSASYELSWANNGASGDIIGPFGGPFLIGKHSSSLPFVYGTPYVITSLLTAGSSASILNGAGASASSLWADTFTFLGQPDGTPGSATFRVNLSGSLTSATSVNAQLADSRSAASVLAALEVDLPQNSWIATGSGAHVPTLPDVGSTGILLGLASSAFALLSKVKSALFGQR